MRKIFWMGLLAGVAMIGSLNAQTNQGAHCIGCFDTMAWSCVPDCGPEGDLPNCYCRVGLCCTDDPSTGTNAAYYSRPDLRDCVQPYCGGDFLYEPPREPLDTCLDELTLVQYVTGIYIFDEAGRLQRIHPDCYQALTGYFAPDRDYPDFDIFIYLPYVP